MIYYKKSIFYFYVSLIFCVSLIPSSSVKRIHVLGIDKFIHLFEFFCLAYLFEACFVQKRISSYLLIFMIPFIDEYLIQRISGRNVDHWDLIFNIIGLCLGITIKRYFDKKN
ncbi:MAG: hypothetical protein CMG00_05070 [Candidatus Marinimicrobia bacterium]|nr:hypothetical protein [Candidatus Neomarinimicrobiota bacterium]|tara:strand:- start:1594 stop:1929 length:336 start_codon:yes stop_codon:yes gene_type:complete